MSHYILDARSGRFWPIYDPVAWFLDHASEPLLELAQERLRTLSAEDGDRIIRLVLRRCRLVLICVVNNASVVVQHWGQPPPDLRPFFKEHRLARSNVQITLANRKNERIVIQPGSAFLYGDPLPTALPSKEFDAKFVRRHVEEVDDWDVAPHAWGTLSWDRAKTDRMIPWSALKSLWRHDDAHLCPNCDLPLVIVRLLWVAPMMFSGIKTVTRACSSCEREFVESVQGASWVWLTDHLDPHLLPTHQHGVKKEELR